MFYYSEHKCVMNFFVIPQIPVL